MTSSVAAPVTTGTYSFATTAGSDLVERVKVAVGADGANPTDLAFGQATKANSLSVTLASDQGTVTTATAGVATATLANVAGSATSVSLFASNSSARQRIIYNDSTAILYVKFGATASTTSFTVKMPADSVYEFPLPCYTGAVDGIWASATGAARTTEVAT